MARVEKTVFRYFGINEAILTNDYDEDTWGAWYEGKIEPFAIALSEALTKASFTAQECKKNRVMFSSSRLQYASNNTKLRVIQGLGSMGYLKVNEGRTIMQLAPIEGGDARPLRGEYYLVDENNNIVAESGGHNTGSVGLSDESEYDPPDDQDAI